MGSPYWNFGNGKFAPVGFNKEGNNVTWKFCEVMDGNNIEFGSGIILSRITNKMSDDLI